MPKEWYNKNLHIINNCFDIEVQDKNKTDRIVYNGKIFYSQKEFAKFIGSSKPTVERWECSDKKISGPIILLLKMLKEYPEMSEKLMIPPKQLPIRMWYMYKNEKCTLIDVDDAKRVVQIKNYTDRIMFRAFGTNVEPTYDDYLVFLEDRCFPRTRDRLKLVLFAPL